MNALLEIMMLDRHRFGEIHVVPNQNVDTSLYLCSTESVKWERIETKGVPPSPRGGFTFTVHSNKVF